MLLVGELPSRAHCSAFTILRRIALPVAGNGFPSACVFAAIQAGPRAKIPLMPSGKIKAVVRAYLISIGVWTALSLLTGWEYRIFDQSLSIHSSLLDMLILAESRGFAYALLTPPIFYLVRRYGGKARHIISYIGVYCAALVPFMLVYVCIRWLVVPPWDPVLQQYVPRNGHGPLELLRSGFADQITMYIAIVFAAHAYVYYERLRKQEVEKYEIQQALAASELQLLKMQLHPHFLFNTLHGISALIDIDPKRAKSMVVKLSSLLRTALEHGSSDLIRLQEEVSLVEEYLDLENMRLGARLRVGWSIDPATEQMLVPHLILQMMVENAIRHGIAPARKGGWMEISSRRNGGNFELQVRNSIGGEASGGTGVGMRNTDARLRYLYADEARFSFALSDDGTATATLVLPALAS